MPPFMIWTTRRVLRLAGKALGVGGQKQQQGTPPPSGQPADRAGADRRPR